jgi:colanic acid biosynthesis glycosyl transferase WcaI
MRVVFLNRFYWPAEPATAQLLLDLATGLAARGWSVTVLTGHSAPGLPTHERHRDVEIVRLGPVMATTQNLARRAVDFVRFHLAALPALLRAVRRGDVVVPLTDPPLIGVTAALVAGLRGARTMHWIHDIYPEVVRAVNPHAGARAANALLRPFRNDAWRGAAACITLGEAMAGLVAEAGVASDRVHIVPNWAPDGVAPAPEAAVAALRREWDLGERFVVGYSGNLGRVHDLGGLLEVAAALRDEPRIVFLFVGHGAAFAALQAAAQARGLAHVRFQPPQPRRALAAVLAAPDLHLVSLRAGCERVVFPSKIYGVAAAGRPMLLLGARDSEIAHAIDKAGMGAVFGPHDVAGLSACLRDLASDPVRRRRWGAAALAFHHANGGAARAIAQWDGLLRAALITR